MGVTAITLVVLRCRDIERSRSFYESLGLELAPEQHGNGPRHYSARIGATVLELYPYAGVETRGVRLGLRVSSLAPALASAEEHGGKVVRVGPPHGPLHAGQEPPAPDAPAHPTALLEDPDGHRIELIEEIR